MKSVWLLSLMCLSFNTHAYFLCHNNHAADSACGSACNPQNGSVRWCVGRNVSCKCSNGIIIDTSIDNYYSIQQSREEEKVTNESNDELVTKEERKKIYFNEVYSD